MEVDRSFGDPQIHTIDMESAGTTAENEFMADFFEEVGQIKTLMSLIRRNIKSIQDAYNTQAWLANEDSERSDELKELLEATNSAANQVRNKLKAMKEENTKLPGDSAQKRIRTNMHGSLTKKFLDMMQEYQYIQTNYKDKSREKLQRRAEIVKPGISKEEVDKLVSQGDADSIFSSQILNDQKKEEAKKALVGIQNQQKDIQQLEKSINELHQIFLDMATVVDSQGELLEQIEHNVNRAVVYSGHATTELAHAQKHSANRRKRVMIATIIIVIILLGIAAAVAAWLSGAF